ANAVTLMRQNVGINLLELAAGARLRKQFGTLQMNDVCRAVEGTAFPPAGFDNLDRVDSLGSNLETTRETCIGLVRKDAAGNVASLVDGFRTNGTQAAVESVSIRAEILEGLSILSRLADTVNGLSAGA